MPIAVQQIFREALTLDPEDRAKLADLLWASLDPVDADLDQLWGKEIDRRLAAYRAGEMETVTSEEVFREFEAL